MFGGCMVMLGGCRPPNITQNNLPYLDKYLDAVQSQDTLIRDDMSKGRNILGLHQLREALSKRRIVQGTERPRLFVWGHIVRGHIVLASHLRVTTLPPCVLTNLEGKVDNPEVGEEEGPLLDVKLHLQL
jgi:hypothetical protein